jgi:hypothetical protein
MTDVFQLSIDEAFQRTYALELLVETPNSPSIETHYLPNGVPNGGPILRVTDVNGKKSLVVIAGEIEGLKVLPWPNRTSFLTLPGAWLIDSDAPERSRRLDGFEGHTVHYAFPLPQHNVVLIGHCCALYCYDSEGLRWAQEDLFCCEDPVLDTADEVLLVTAHKHGKDPEDTPTLKRLDLKTGKRIDSA